MLRLYSKFTKELLEISSLYALHEVFMIIEVGVL
jgi:hypothetical protein